MSAHRMVWEECFGDIPDGLLVLHRCDNKWCVNPEHLELGTQKENLRQMSERGRSLRGERNPKTKLTDVQIGEIRRLRSEGVILSEIACRFAVSTARVHQIIYYGHRS